MKKQDGVMILRISRGAKDAFAKYARKKKTSMSKLVINYVESVTGFKKAS